MTADLRRRSRRVAPLIARRDLAGRSRRVRCLERSTRGRELNAFITVMRRRALGRRDAGRAEIAAGRYRGPLHGIPVVGEGSDRRRRHADDVRIARAAAPADARRAGRAAAARGRRDHHRQDQPARVRVRHDQRRVARSARCGIRSTVAIGGRIERRLGGGAARRHVLRRARHRHRRLDPHPGRGLRHRRPEADARRAALPTASCR